MPSLMPTPMPMLTRTPTPLTLLVKRGVYVEVGGRVGIKVGIGFGVGVGSDLTNWKLDELLTQQIFIAPILAK